MHARARSTGPGLLLRHSSLVKVTASRKSCQRWTDWTRREKVFGVDWGLKDEVSSTDAREADPKFAVEQWLDIKGDERAKRHSRFHLVEGRA